MTARLPSAGSRRRSTRPRASSAPSIAPSTAGMFAVSKFAYHANSCILLVCQLPPPRRGRGQRDPLAPSRHRGLASASTQSRPGPPARPACASARSSPPGRRSARRRCGWPSSAAWTTCWSRTSRRRPEVSPRTFNNYFASKYEAICALALDRSYRIGEALRARPAGESLWDAITERGAGGVRLGQRRRRTPRSSPASGWSPARRCCVAST